MPHHEFPDGEDEKYPSMRLDLPNTFFNCKAAARKYQNYFDEYVLADEVGFNSGAAITANRRMSAVHEITCERCTPANAAGIVALQ